MNRDEKAAVIDEVAGEIGSADAIFAVDYRGITVSQVAELRTKLRDSDTKLRVVKNSLSELAADKAGAGDLKSLLMGPTALALVRGDAAAAAKVLSDTARALRGPLEFKGGLMAGSLLTATDVEAIAKLPAREILHGQLVGTIAAPLSGLVRTLNALISGLAVQLGQIAEQGLVSGTAAEAPAAEDASSAELDLASDAPSAPEADAATELADAAEDAPAAEEAPPAAEEEAPAAVEEAPPAAEEAPPAAEEAPPAAEEAPAAAEEPPPAAEVEETPPASEAAAEASPEDSASTEDSQSTEGTSDDAPSDE